MSDIEVKVEFLGGLDSVFGGVRELTVALPSGSVLKDLILRLAERITNEKDLEIFLEDETIRPGIIVLVNDTDWELEGEEMYELQRRDLITFTSTLHGG